MDRPCDLYHGTKREISALEKNCPVVSTAPLALQCATRHRLPAARYRFDLKQKTGNLDPGEDRGAIEITAQWFFNPNPKIAPDLKQKRKQGWPLTGHGIDSDTEVGQFLYSYTVHWLYCTVRGNCFAFLVVRCARAPTV